MERRSLILCGGLGVGAPPRYGQVLVYEQAEAAGGVRVCVAHDVLQIYGGGVGDEVDGEVREHAAVHDNVAAAAFSVELVAATVLPPSGLPHDLAPDEGNAH